MVKWGQTKKEIEIRRTAVARLYEQGYYPEEMLPILEARFNKTCSRSTIYNDIKAIRAEWARERIDSYEELVAVQARKMTVNRREAMDGYRLSQEEETSRDRRIGTPDGSGDGGTSRVEQERVKRTGLGDPRFLEIVHKIDCEMNKLLGAYPAEKKEISGDLTFTSFLMESGLLDEETEKEE